VKIACLKILKVLRCVAVWDKHHWSLLGNPQISSEIFGNLRKMFGNVRVALGKFWKIFEDLRKEVRNIRKIEVPSDINKEDSRNRGYYLPAIGYEFYLRVLNSISNEWAQRISEISSWTREHKIHIQSRACNIVYFSNSPHYYHSESQHLLCAYIIEMWLSL